MQVYMVRHTFMCTLNLTMVELSNLDILYALLYIPLLQSNIDIDIDRGGATTRVS
jgi:hypothetical protein